MRIQGSQSGVRRGRPQAANPARSVRVAVVGCAILVPHATASAGFVEFTDKDEWIAAVRGFTTIHFNEVPKHTFVTDEYAEHGVLFTDGDDQIDFGASFVNDGWGLDGNGDINVAFSEPQLWIATDHPGSIKFQLFRDGELIYDGISHFTGGVGFFVGIVASEPFDAARIFNPLGDEKEIDDLHFGVPAPGALWLIVPVSLSMGRRRRPTRMGETT